MKIDLALTATRRADLLETAVASLERYLFPHFDVVRSIVNVDPIYGDADPVPIIERLPRRLTLTMPHQPDHATAVKRIWGASSAAWLLHWEDDYELLEPITPADLAGAAIQPIWHDEKRPHRLSRPKWAWKTPHGTSPRFLTGHYARRMAVLLERGLCPEKQVSREFPTELPLNRGAYDFARLWDGRYLLPKRGQVLARHHGRRWLRDNGVAADA